MSISQASHLRCLCQNINEPASLLLSQTLPIDTEICHCNTCRHTSGALCPAFVPLKSAPSPESLASCTRYGSRYFCTTCGCRTFDAAKGEWFACSGVVEPPSSTSDNDEECGWEGDVIRITSHDFVTDTLDGSLAPYLSIFPTADSNKDNSSSSSSSSRAIPYFPQGRTGTLMTRFELTTLQTQAAKLPREPKLLASCHCSSVKFHILPPTHLPPSITLNPSVKKWLRDNGTKYLGLHCACNYCRRATGFSFTSNVYVVPENIVAFSEIISVLSSTSTYKEDDTMESLFDYTSQSSTTDPLNSSTSRLTTKLPSLRFDFSSPGIRRSWCGTCGAAVFFERDSRPQVVNVAVGILRAESGALAEKWVAFGSEVWFKEFAVDREMVRALEGGLGRANNE